LTNHTAFLSEIAQFVPKKRIYTDELRRLAYGTDAGFYRLIPQIVLRSADEQEVSRILAVADQHGVPITFRAAGTSLSGQAISDSVLLVAGKHWEKYSISSDHKTITLQPGIIGERVNQLLKPIGRRFSPDPASVKSAMVGGIVVNNASGMNCGTHANSDQVLLSARIVLADGTILDTGNTESRSRFAKTKPEFIRKIEQLRDSVRNHSALAERIRHKYSIKNVVGLNLLPFLRYDDPFDIIAHLMVGSEGTLAFLSEVTMQTETEYPFKASGMLYFTDIKDACRAVAAMKKLVNAEGQWTVHSAELLDAVSLKAVEDSLTIPLQKGLTAVLTETKDHSQHGLAENIARIREALNSFTLAAPFHFTEDEKEYAPYWEVRSGIFPTVGGTRPAGTTTLIEDIAFPVDVLPEATAELQKLLQKSGYDNACIYGHALEGNFHFIINQSFDSDAEVKRYESLMNEVAKLVVERYDGSLKAEHGTGRNMAPFVKYEWGEDAYSVMQEVKNLFDPKGLLNPGVIFNDDPQCHLKNFKPLPIVSPIVDKCIECGFCEVNCLTCGLTISSRQRIAIQREIARQPNTAYAKTLQKQYRYYGEQTCAGDSLCSMSCPMKINVADLTHWVRGADVPPGSWGHWLGNVAANHLHGIKNCLRPVLWLANLAHAILGSKLTTLIGKALHVIGIPLWTPSLPSLAFVPGTKGNTGNTGVQGTSAKRVVYFPSCINQAMCGPAGTQPLIDEMVLLLRKGGYDVVFPKQMDNLCCGTIWESKGMEDIADRKSKELEDALYEVSNQGEYPILCDQSPCLYRMRHTMKKVKLYEPVEFINTFLLDKLQFSQSKEPISVHITCSMRKMGLGDQLIELAKRCSADVLVPEEVGCCGFAGDRGFWYPEVNEYALRHLRPQVEQRECRKGYSNSRTCEIGLTTYSGIPYQSIVYLVNERSAKK
jgi:D-lactate dehydrogenase